MVFSSLLFLFIFLPIVIFTYFISPKRYRNLILFIASLVFYAWGEPIYILAMIFSSIVDYTHGLLIERFRDKKNITKIVLLSSIAINLSLLGFFKYYDFFIGTINNVFDTSYRIFKLPLPIGISFYTFQTMSYTIDVYRGKFKAQKNIINFGTYVSLFSQLIAGPIVLYEDIAFELENRRESIDSFGEGVRRFVIGLGKKILIANNIGLLWDEVQRLQPIEMSVVTAWIGILAFAFQIYFDFSGYSDMAIGLSKMFGFKFPENFNYPYISKNISEFWRRWHISLGGWFKEYVYIPLGGNRGSSIRKYRNLFIVWFLTGLWHGASWNFVIWGLYFGIIIAIEKAVLLRYLNKVPSLISHLYAKLVILVGWVIFSIEDLPKGIQYLKAMFGLSKLRVINSQAIYYIYTYGVVFIIAILASTPIMLKLMERLKQKSERAYHCVSISAIACIMVLSVAYLVDATYNPFLYFRF